MTKEIKAIIIATIVACIIMISCAYAMPTNAEESGSKKVCSDPIFLLTTT